MKRGNAVRSLLLSMLVAASTVAAPAFAQISVNINIAPPALLYETAPAMAPGYVWAPGYWAWHGDRYIWVHGRAIVQRAGYRWEPDRWEQRGGAYFRQPGGWERDPDYKVVKMKKEKKLKPGENGGGKNKHGKGNAGRQDKGHKQDR